ncbi:Synaptic vesicle transporter SVOP and related transporters (major facilitator superfamily) [Phaffia rhodozyma]|uniref:Synaptic vesicle transporter SVOP and related transporters (Major facilitator superfamily) n=1 Tax=Phaffia rhodozyma TaxID=264483 RepID=A0A0F7STJ7_PHARH|nr:Synaptic vesicle transporter SVOP and related transporters (major facilitator superfamily) [Phaffia rhodozyma]
MSSPHSEHTALPPNSQNATPFQTDLASISSPSLEETIPVTDGPLPNENTDQSQTQQESLPVIPTKPHSVFTPRQKAWIVAGVSSIGVFSPLSANIFVPALPLLASAFKQTAEEMNLTVSIYLVFQGLSPTFWGSMADVFGRRPVYLLTMAIYIASCIVIAVLPTSAFWALLFLRVVQAFGGSSVIAIGAGVVSDISEQHERGGFMGWYSLGNMLAPAIGPVLGGILAQYLGWRAIFWFLVIASSTALIPIAFFLPETLRLIVGNGSIHPPLINQPFAQIFTGRRARQDAKREGISDLEKAHEPSSSKSTQPTLKERRAMFRPLQSLELLLNPDLFMMLFFSSLIYMEFYCILTATSSLFKNIYGLSEIKIGLCYLSNGAGCILGSLLPGRMLDWDYRQMKRELPDDSKPLDFPIERARLKRLPFLVALTHISAIGFGWALYAQTSLAVPVVLHFFIGFSNTAMMLMTQTLVVDLFPGKGSSVTASFNLLRCSLGAVGTSTIDIIITRLNVGWTFVLLSGICLAASPLPWLIVKIGPKRRRRRAAEAAARAAGRE